MKIIINKIFSKYITLVSICMALQSLAADKLDVMKNINARTLGEKWIFFFGYVLRQISDCT